jgi:hypothetical protein
MPTPPGFETCGRPHPQPACGCVACVEARGVVAVETKFDEVSDLSVGDEAWVYARNWWRRARVVSTARSRVRVAYRLQGGRGIKTTDAPLEILRRAHYKPPAGSTQWAPAPRLSDCQEVPKP